MDEPERPSTERAQADRYANWQSSVSSSRTGPFGIGGISASINDAMRLIFGRVDSNNGIDQEEISRDLQAFSFSHPQSSHPVDVYPMMVEIMGNLKGEEIETRCKCRMTETSSDPPH